MKKHTNMTRLLSLLLCLVMVLGMVPAMALAAGTDEAELFAAVQLEKGIWNVPAKFVLPLPAKDSTGRYPMMIKIDWMTQNQGKGFMKMWMTLNDAGAVRNNAAEAARVDAMITALGEISLASETAIAAARAAYAELVPESQAKVAKLDTLTAAETKLQELKDTAAQAEANKNILARYPGKAWNEDLLTPVKAVPGTVIVSDPLVESSGKTLSLDGEIHVNYYYTFNKGTQVQSAKTGGGVEYSAQSEGNVRYSDILAYSPEAYAAGRIAKNSAVADTAKALVLYGEEAKAYFTK